MESDTSASQLRDLLAVSCRNITAVSGFRSSHAHKMKTRAERETEQDDKHKSGPRPGVCARPELERKCCCCCCCCCNQVSSQEGRLTASRFTTEFLGHSPCVWPVASAAVGTGKRSVSRRRARVRGLGPDAVSAAQKTCRGIDTSHASGEAMTALWSSTPGLIPLPKHCPTVALRNPITAFITSPKSTKCHIFAARKRKPGCDPSCL